MEDSTGMWPTKLLLHRTLLFSIWYSLAFPSEELPPQPRINHYLKYAVTKHCQFHILKLYVCFVWSSYFKYICSLPVHSSDY